MPVRQLVLCAEITARMPDPKNGPASAGSLDQLRLAQLGFVSWPPYTRPGKNNVAPSSMQILVHPAMLRSRVGLKSHTLPELHGNIDNHSCIGSDSSTKGSCYRLVLTSSTGSNDT